VESIDQAFASISAGYFHTCSLTTGNSLYCWGWNTSGQIGDGTLTNRLSPKKIGTSGVWGSPSAGVYNSCAITTA
jgi:alpha-tubulin suppressor-like RCC1 family protein